MAGVGLEKCKEGTCPKKISSTKCLKYIKNVTANHNPTSFCARSTAMKDIWQIFVVGLILLAVMALLKWIGL